MPDHAVLLPPGLPAPEHGRALDRGHYESRFFRANHPDLPLALWLRHTIRIPRDPRSAPVAEVWALFFDGQRREVTPLRRAWPLADCRWGDRVSRWEIGTSSLEVGASTGGVTDEQTAGRAGWDLRWRAAPGALPGPGLLLPRYLYGAQVPTPKTLTLAPLVTVAGWLNLNGRHVDLDGWTGSDNHNWGARHSHRYAWAQVCGFDDAPDATLEAVCSRPRVAGLPGPAMTLLLLRLDGREYALNSLLQALRTRSQHTTAGWNFDAQGADGVRLCGQVRQAHPTLTARLRYDSPCGAVQVCHNSKLAPCTLVVSRPGLPDRTLRTVHRAAFETLDPAA